MKIDGRELAQKILGELETEVAMLKEQAITPHLVVILVGNDPASEAYVRQKKLKGESIGMQVTIQNFNKDVSNNELLSTIEAYNNDKNIHGIIVQQPLPEHIDVDKIIEATDPKKDVDGFHKDSAFTPPIAEGVEEILKSVFSQIASSSSTPHNDDTFLSWLRKKNVVVVGKGETGGMPIIQKMRRLGVEPTIIDSKTQDPLGVKKNADIIISCVGRSRIVKADELKQGVILLSIGMFRGEDGKLHGDYEDDEIKGIASYYTPVPGGVGPMNVAMLLKNVIQAAKAAS